MGRKLEGETGSQRMIAKVSTEADMKLNLWPTTQAVPRLKLDRCLFQRLLCLYLGTIEILNLEV
jgi:hypothetical protein